jgi:4'-phosphopantetheinyl transferase
MKLYFTTTKHSEQTVNSQAFVKEKLAEYYQCEPQDIVLSKTPNGKPFVSQPDIQPCPCYFNLSHSCDYIVLAVSNQPVGVDIEYMKDRNFLAIAKHYFQLSEVEALQTAGRENSGNRELRKLFYTYWTLKEALIKCQGSTIAEMLRELEFSVVGDSYSLLLPQSEQNYIFSSEIVFENYVCSTCVVSNNNNNLNNLNNS